jgi:nucleolar MIF4G domain-containing protein 1
MSRQKQGIRLPYALQKELGLDTGTSRVRKRGDGQNDRKARRAEKHRSRVRGTGPGSGPHQRPGRDGERVERQQQHRIAGSLHNVQDQKHPLHQTVIHKPSPSQAKAVVANKPKSILKKTKAVPPPPRSPSPSSVADEENNYEDDSDDSLQFPRDMSPEIVLDASSRSYKDQQADNDAEIMALERKLGLKQGKIPKASQEDGFGSLLGGLGEGSEGRQKRKREDENWLKEKREKVKEQLESDMDSAASRSDQVSDSEDEYLNTEAESVQSMDSKEGVPASEDMAGEDYGNFDGFESDENYLGQPPAQFRVRENPYVAPTTVSATNKYIPPSLRQKTVPPTDDRLRRQLQGHLNKLSFANLVSILTSIESLYHTHPRAVTTTAFIDLLLSLFCTPTSLQTTFIILHAGFITALYRVLGVDFGAEFLSRLINRFNTYHTSTTTTKEPLNLISLLSHLFTFSMLGSGMIYSHLSLLLSSTPLTESNTELLLRIIRDCGPQLRSDDPVALKAIVSQTQSAASTSQSSEHGQEVSVRTKFMIETILDLKNNKMRDSANNSAVTKEHITRMTKILGTLASSSRSLRATEPLRISLEDLQSSDKKGKWWLVGASWKGSEASQQQRDGVSISLSAESVSNDAHTNKSNMASARDNSDDIVTDSDAPTATPTPKDFGLSTPLQISIFTAISTSTSYIDAHLRLTKLRLKRAQEPEIARVLLRLCGAESVYNPFYAHVAKRLCTLDGGKRGRKMWEFGLWGWLRRIGEGNGDDEDDEGFDARDGDGATGNVQVEEVNNIAHVYASLIAWGVVDLAVIRVLDLQYLKENGELFVEMLLVRILVDCKTDEEVERIFSRCEDAKQIVPSLNLFLKEKVRVSDLAGRKESKVLAARTKLARKVLEGLSGSR